MDGTFETVLETLRRRILLIVICTIATAASAVVFSLLQEKQYTASASLLFRDPQFAQSVFGTGAESFSSPDETRQAATNVVLASLHTISERTAASLGGDFTAEEIDSAIEVSAEGQSDVVSVEATDTDPESAQMIVDSFAEEFINFRAQADKTKLLAAKRLADRQFALLTPSEQVGPRGEQLSRGAEKLGILASLQTGNAELVQPAELPTSPSSPKTMRNTFLGLVLGLLVGIGLAFISERLDRRLRKPEDVEEAFGLPVLGTIPESKAIADSNTGSEIGSLPFAETESFRMVRASLRYFSIDQDIRTVLIASGNPKEGKSTVAWNLANIAALGSRVLLIETDLRRPSMSRQHGILPGPGLSELLTHQVTLDDVLQTKSVTHKKGSDEEEGRLDVIVGGAPPPNPAELLESKTITDIISSFREKYDLVLIDTAPIGVVSDALPLAKYADGVLLITRLDQSTRDSAKRLKEQLLRSQAQLLGVVANSIRVGRLSKYGYGYGYANAYSTKDPEGSKDSS